LNGHLVRAKKVKDCRAKKLITSIDEEIELYFDDEQPYALNELLESFLPWLAMTDIPLNSLEYVDEGLNLAFYNVTFNYGLIYFQLIYI
jgi:hypothetical protein